MAKPNEHLTLANVNHATLLYLLKDHVAHPEWIATVAFYKAVHVIEAVLAHKYNWHSNDHRSRLDKIKNNMVPAAFIHMNALYGKSRIARYLSDAGTGYASFTSHITADEVVKHLVGKRLVAIEQICICEIPSGHGLNLINRADLPI